MRQWERNRTMREALENENIPISGESPTAIWIKLKSDMLEIRTETEYKYMAVHRGRFSLLVSRSCSEILSKVKDLIDAD